MPRRPGKRVSKPHANDRLARQPDVSNRAAWLLLGGLGVVFVTLTVTSLRDKSVTIDEFGHLPAGHNLLATGNLDYCEFNPPLLNVLSALPLRFGVLSRESVASPPEPEHKYSFWANGYSFMKRHPDRYHRIFVTARLVTVLLAILLGVVAFRWVRILVPARPNVAGLLAVALIWFSPEVLAHARLVTTDVGAAFFILLAITVFHGYLRTPRWPRTIGAGVALGAAQLAKFTAVYLYPVYAVIAAAWIWTHREGNHRKTAIGLGGLFAVSLLVINAGFMFQGSGRTLGRYELQSGPFRSIQKTLPSWLPVPLPKQYLRAFDRQLVDAESNEPAFLFGETFTGGRWYYYLALLAIKTPIPLLLLGVLAVYTALRGVCRSLYDRAQYRNTHVASDSRRLKPAAQVVCRFAHIDWAVHLLLILPAGVILFTFSFFSHHQVGLRLILPAVVLGLVWIAIVLGSAVRSRWMSLGTVALLGWLVIESTWIHPDYLAYFNEFVGGPAQGARYALDANLDWGQDLPKLKRFMEDKDLASIQLLYYGRVDPSVYGIPYEVPKRGIHTGYRAVSASLYVRG